MLYSLYSIFIYCVLILNFTSAEKILLFAGPSISHFRENNGVGVALLDRKHNVHMLLSTTTVKSAKDPRYKLITYEDNQVAVFDEKSGKQWINDFAINSSPFKMFAKFLIEQKSKFASICNNTVGNKELVNKLKKEKYDLVIIDSISLFLCFHLLPDYLNVSHVALGTETRLSSARLSEPFIRYFSFDTMISRFLTYVMAILFENMHYMFFDYDSLSEAVGYTYQNVGIMAEKSKLWLANSDFLLQPPQSVPPHVRMVGGLSLQNFEPLDESYKSFVDNAKEGFVVLTFGSMMAYFPHEVAVKFAKAFQLIQGMKVVMRMNGDEVDLFKNHENVMIRPWLPQNDLLAHGNCKLFISHCGNSGQFEALYHAIPILGFPLFGDQKHNSERIENRGYGLSFKLSDFTPEDLAKSILDMSRDNSSYKLKIAAASRVYRRRKSARERAADAVEEVLRGESDFYYPYDSYKLNAWNYNHLDLLLLMFCGIQALVLFFGCTLWICVKCVCWRKRTHKVKCKSQ